MRAVGHQVQAHRPLLRLPDRHAQGSRSPACLLGPPTKTSRESILSVHARHRPPPGRAHRSVVGDAHPRAPRRQVFHARGVTDVEDTGVTWASRAVRALLAGAHVDVDARVPEHDGGGAVPPHARSSRLGRHLTGAPQRAFGAVGARDSHGRALRRRGALPAGREHDPTRQARGLPRPHGRAQRRRDGSSGRQRREDEGEGRPVPSESASVRPPCQHRRHRERQRGHAQRHARGKGRPGKHRMKPPAHEDDHEKRRDDGKDSHEGGGARRAATPAGDARPGQVMRPGTHLEGVLSQADSRSCDRARVCEGVRPYGEEAPGAYCGGAGSWAQQCARGASGEGGVLARHARARQGDVARSPDRAGGEDQPDVGAANARQVQARAQGCARQATTIVHASTLDPASCAFKRLRRACGRGGKGKVLGGQLARVLWAWPPRVRPSESAPPLGAAKCDNGPHV